MERLVGNDDQIYIVYPKAEFILFIVLSIVFFLGFFFFLFITVVVIRKEEKIDKVLVAMLIFLQLAALSQAVCYVLSADCDGKYFT